MKQWRRERLLKLAEKRDWSNDKINAVTQRIEDRQATIKNVASKIGVPLAAALASAVPGGALLGNLINKIPIVSELPAIKSLAVEGAATIQAELDGGHGPLSVVIRDIVPCLRDIMDGDYKAALVALPVAAGGVVVALKVLGII